MNSLCIIPARGGSKRIPRKNLKFFLGKPILLYSIEIALESGLFDEVMVSTDDEEIKEIALANGAEVPFLRDPKTSDDHSTLNDVFWEVVNKYDEKGKTFNYHCLMLPTAPLITVELLQKAKNLLNDSTFDSVRPIVEFPYPVQRAQRLNINGQVSFINAEYSRTRSQDLEQYFYDAGMFYFIRKGKDLTQNKGAFTIKSILSQDIDNHEDWEIAEFKYKYLKAKGL